MLFAKGIRIVMRGAGQGLRYGIKSIKVHTQDQTALFLEKSERKTPRCFASAESNFNVIPRPHLLMDCITAMEQNDSREIYILNEYSIQQWADNNCLRPVVVDEKNQENLIIGTGICEAKEDQKFIVHENGMISQQKNPEMCIVAA